jgi:hypothetical protein
MDMHKAFDVSAFGNTTRVAVADLRVGSHAVTSRLVGAVEWALRVVFSPFGAGRSSKCRRVGSRFG